MMFEFGKYVGEVLLFYVVFLVLLVGLVIVSLCVLCKVKVVLEVLEKGCQDGQDIVFDDCVIGYFFGFCDVVFCWYVVG